MTFERRDPDVEVTALGGVPHGGAVKGAVEGVDMLQGIERVFDELGRISTTI